MLPYEVSQTNLKSFMYSDMKVHLVAVIANFTMI